MIKKPHRVTPRVGLNVIVELPDGRFMTSSFSKNISATGLFIEIYPLIAIGEKVRLSFRLPTRNRLLHVEGRVRWSRDDAPDGRAAGVGIEFENPSQEFVDELKLELDLCVK